MTGWDPDARVLGIVRYRQEGDLDAVVEALGEGGVPLVEVTLDTPGALGAIERSAAAGRAVGAGTVLSADDVSRSADAGARFVVSPGLLPEVVERALRLEIDVVPGAFTPTEIFRAHSLDATAVKLFPAAVVGPAYVRSVLAPLEQVPLVPTGGIEVGDVAAYLEAGASCVGLGASLVGGEPPADDEAIARIAERAAAAVAAARR